jgi:hypothetical protein
MQKAADSLDYISSILCLWFILLSLTFLYWNLMASWSWWVLLMPHGSLLHLWLCMVSLFPFTLKISYLFST